MVQGPGDRIPSCVAFWDDAMMTRFGMSGISAQSVIVVIVMAHYVLVVSRNSAHHVTFFSSLREPPSPSFVTLPSSLFGVREVTLL